MELEAVVQLAAADKLQQTALQLWRSCGIMDQHDHSMLAARDNNESEILSRNIRKAMKLISNGMRSRITLTAGFCGYLASFAASA